MRSHFHYGIEKGPRYSGHKTQLGSPRRILESQVVRSLGLYWTAPMAWSWPRSCSPNLHGFPLVLLPVFGFHDLYNVLSVVSFLFKLVRVVLLLLFVTDNFDPCVDRYYSLSTDKTFGAQGLTVQLMMDRLSHPGVLIPMTIIQQIFVILWLCARLLLAWGTWWGGHGWEASTGLCKVWLGPWKHQDHWDSRVWLMDQNVWGSD